MLYFFQEKIFMSEKSQKNDSALECFSTFRQRPEDVIYRVEMGMVKKIVLIFGIIFLFILALQVIKSSVGGSTGNIFQEHVKEAVSTPRKAFSFGWLGTVLLLSGSPVSATGVSLFSAGFFDQTALFYLILGSRGGPDLVLFLVGLVTYIRRRTIRRTLGLGLIEFFTTLSVIIFTALFGPLILRSGLNESLARIFAGAAEYTDFIGVYIEPLGKKIVSMFSSSTALLAGIFLLVAAIFLFDKFFSFFAFEKKTDEEERTYLENEWRLFKKNPVTALSSFMRELFRKKSFSDQIRSRFQRILANPFFAFLLGAVITGITMSTAVSVGILVPFYAYNVIGIRTIVPYVLAANITTFSDTLFLSILTGNFQAVETVTSFLVASGIFALLAGIFFKYYLYGISSLSRFFLVRPWRLAVVVLFSILVPMGVVFF
ncbi:hypothetical protein HZA41_00270 [Candidatus Peregrinibacteria bacterium]|nr:hypothetical protein [Candidatus Peregrinibacteria bacterium]